MQCQNRVFTLLADFFRGLPTIIKIITFPILLVLMLFLCMTFVGSFFAYLAFAITRSVWNFLVFHIAFLIILVQHICLIKLMLEAVIMDVVFSEDWSNLALQLMLIFFIPILFIRDMRSL